MELDKPALEKFNGKEGKPTYVAAEGKIYDVTQSKLWKNGLHMNRHQAGQDLSGLLAAAPHGLEVLQRYPHVGILKATLAAPKIPLPKWIIGFLEKYPFFKRHPHPMVVHFPMVYFITASLLLMWYYVVDAPLSFLDAIFYMHALGTISLPAAIFTGWLSWKANYFGKPIGYIVRKIILTFFVFLFDIIVLLSLLYQPDILVSPHGFQIVIPLMIFLYLPLVSIIGHHGGQLVY